jgi:hypothetical protein
MSNIMIDLETMGTGSNAAIVAIGAVKFNSKGIADEFYETVDLATSVEIGMEIEPDTEMWWLGQPDKARKAITRDATDIGIVLNKFTAWVGDDVKLWGNGADFDNVILANAYKLMGNRPPWAFYNNRCYRTVKNLLGKNIEYVKPKIPHHAFWDAKAQAEHLIKILALVGSK